MIYCELQIMLLCLVSSRGRATFSARMNHPVIRLSPENDYTMYLLTYTHRSRWSIGHLRPLAIALCSRLLWSFQTSWSLAVSALLQCLASNCCEAGLSSSSHAGWRVMLLEGVSDSVPLPPQYLLGHGFLSGSLPQIFISDLFLPSTTPYNRKEFICVQKLLILTAYIVYRNWTHLLYAWKALRRHQLPNRLRDFTRDVYFVYADTDRDVMWACLTLPALLRQHRALRILLRNQEEDAGADKAESIAQHIETSWKVGSCTSSLPT